MAGLHDSPVIGMYSGTSPVCRQSVVSMPPQYKILVEGERTAKFQGEIDKELLLFACPSVETKCTPIETKCTCMSYVVSQSHCYKNFCSQVSAVQLRPSAHACHMLCHRVTATKASFHTIV